jgi:hypothetical protein
MGAVVGVRTAVKDVSGEDTGAFIDFFQEVKQKYSESQMINVWAQMEPKNLDR